ncbi:unnamed protein product [Musa acuminata subsp. burmannicoides]
MQLRNFAYNSDMSKFDQPSDEESHFLHDNNVPESLHLHTYLSHPMDHKFMYISFFLLNYVSSIVSC